MTGAQAEKEVAALQDLLNRLNSSLYAALNKLEIELTQQALLAASRMGTALEGLSNAVGGDAALMIDGQAELTTFVNQLQEAQDRLADAVKAGDTDAADAARQEIEALSRETQARISSVNSITQFAETLNRVSKQLVDAAFGELQGDAERARRDSNAAASRAGPFPAQRDEAEFAKRQRHRVEQDVRNYEDRKIEIEERRRRAVADFESNNVHPDIKRLIKERDETQAEIDRARAENRTVDQDVIDRNRRANRELDRKFEDSPEGWMARGEADKFDQDAARRRRFEDDVRRGRELGQTPAQQAGKQIADDLVALKAAFEENPIKDEGDYKKDQRRIVQDALRSTAPAIAALSDSVENAVVQGPSRAALQASDITTSQGAAELNRLLRGDDSAKNQDLVELQKQSQSLQELVQIARDNGAPPGVL